MKVNYHTHSRYCRHAQGQVRDFAETAFKSGLDVLGFSDHAPFPIPLFGGGDAGSLRYGNGMDFDELDSYLGDVEKERNRYAGKMKIFSSLEIEYLDEFDKVNFPGRENCKSSCELSTASEGVGESSYYQWLLKEKKLDYLLLGAHFYRDREGNFQNIYNIEKAENVIDYAEACKRALLSGYFKIIAHPDIFAMRDFSGDERCQEFYQKASEIILEAAKVSGTILEYNANGFRRGLFDYGSCKRYQYPLRDFWLKVSDMALPVLVGSDCHSPEQVYDSFVEASYKELEKLGIKALEEIF
ncbi:MAG: histidinol-phosphatase [Treponema sp.]|nr:histidinol-phosphatase [Treponema sp.]